ncbi:MAG TPA: chloride channel protein [Kofleriaceae bacterium]|jgi:CIC family chloride channel protein|nr:chloride channel protein [Kofleriaceae bacterium]
MPSLPTAELSPTPPVPAPPDDGGEDDDGPPGPPTIQPATAPGAGRILIEQAARFYRKAYQSWLLTKQRLVPSERQRLFWLTIAIGGVCGLAAVAFHVAIEYMSERTIERAMAAEDYSWIPWTLVVPAIGGLLAGLLLYYVVPNARGSGVPQIKVAYASKSGRLRVRDSLGKFAIGVLQIGTGSALGREGPTVQICAGVAGGLGRIAGISQRNLKRLIPVGAAAGIAAAFNAPIAAVTFTIEEIVGTLDQTLLSGVIVAAALAAVVERTVLGGHPVFDLKQTFSLDSASSLLLYAVLGVAAAVVSVTFTESLLQLRKWFATLRLPRWAQPAIGGLVTGGLAVAALAVFHSQGITGGGYRQLADALGGKLALQVLLGLGLLKLIATVWSYSSGGAGGIFAPALFIGGMLGGATGYLDVALFGNPPTTIASFALVGMGAVFAGVIRAPITSVLIIIEMTNGYSLILPLMIANMTAYGLARRWRPVPIYEALLDQDGVHLHTQPAAVDAIDTLRVDQVPEIDRDFVSFYPALPAVSLLADLATAGRQELFPVLDQQEVLVGMILLEDLTMLAGEPQLQGGLVNAADIMRPPIVLGERDTLRTAYDRLVASGLRELPVIDRDRRVIALINDVAIAHAYLQARRTHQMRAEPGDSMDSLPAE